MEADSTVEKVEKPMMLWMSLRYLVDRYNIPGGVPYALISSELGYCNSGVRKLVKELKDLGMVAITYSGHGQGKLARVMPLGEHEFTQVDPRWGVQLPSEVDERQLPLPLAEQPREANAA